ncbi:MAG: hypothetical protein JMDDDDMK_00234 [Acidobacteria bacterium]|nr:hypothetical protein [Acidobacteriota bacterium]
MQRSGFHTHVRLAFALTALAGLVIWLGYSWSGSVKARGAKAGEARQSLRDASQPSKSLNLSSITDRAFGAGLGASADLNATAVAPMTTITVTTTANAIAADGQCSLREAIINANNDAATHADCAAGSGADTILLAAGATYTLDARDNTEYGFNGLPAITSQITIDGSGATITRGVSAQAFRLFYVASNGDLTLQNLTLSNGLAKGGDGGAALSGGGGGGAGLGGAVFNKGALALVNSVISGSTAQGGNGGAGNGDYGNATGGGGGGGIGGRGGAGTIYYGGGGGGGFGGNGASPTNNCTGHGGGGGGGTVGNGSSTCSTTGGAGGLANGGAGGNFGFPGTAGGYGGGGGGAGGAQSSGSIPTGGAGGIGGGGGGGGFDGTISEPHGNGGAGGFGGAGGGGGQSSGGSFGGNGGAGGFAGGGGGGGQGGTTPTTHAPGAGGQGGFGAGNGATAGRNYGSGGGGGGGLGGAIFNDQGGVITLTGCTLSGNTAQGGGGGNGSNGNINNLPNFPGSIGGNGGSGYGGAIFNRNGSVTFTDCTLSGNLVTAGAGGVGRVGNGAVGNQNGCAIYNLQQSGGAAIVTLINTTPDTGTGCDSLYNNGGTINTPPPCQTITLNPPSLPAGRVNAIYGQTIMASGGASPYNFAVMGGSLPGGLSLAPTGALSGTPNASGAFSFTVTATDANGCTGSLGYNLTINANSAPDAVNDVATTTEDTAVIISALDNDTDVDGDTLTVTGITQPANGSATLNANGTVTYTPSANFNSSDSFGYVVSDGNGGSSSATVTVTVAAVNDAPSFTKGANQNVLEDAGAQTVSNWAANISAGAANEAGQTVNFVVTGNTNPALFTSGPAISASGALSFTPAPNANGGASITIELRDNGGTANGGVDTSAAQTFDINVTAVNDAPSFTRGADQTALEDAGAQTGAGWAISISPGPADEVGQTVSFLVTNDNNALFASQPAVSANGALTYTPAPNAFGSATVTVTAQDNGGTANGGIDTSAPQTFVINITPVNDAPSFTKGADQSALEDAGAQTISGWATNISPGPADESSQTVSFLVSADNSDLFAAQPAISANGALTFTPAANANGSATVTVALKDNGGLANGGVDTSAPQNFVINVTAVNDPPAAVNDSYSTNEDTMLNIAAPGALSNDTDVEGNPLTAIIMTGPANGALTLNANGSFIYAPNANFNGGDSFTYRANDGAANSNTVTVTITIAAVNDAPDAVNDSATTDEGAPITISALSNDTDVDGDTLSVTNVTQPANGTAAINGNGTITYTPNANFSGANSFTYTISDGAGGADTATVNVLVVAVNGNPVARPDAAVTPENTPVDISVLANDTDPDGDALTVISVTQGAYGSVAINPNGTVKYTPNPNTYGTDSFTYTVSDGQGGTATGAVTTGWSNAGSLNAARMNHTVTRLSNGQVLASGGLSPGGVTASAELYNPANDSWQTTGSLNNRRSQHTATLLSNGKTLVAGGLNSFYISNAELYDPVSGTWSFTGSLATARHSHTATRLSDGRILVAGGVIPGDTATTSAEIYNPATGQWSVTGSLLTARELHTATLLSNGKVLVAGGDTGSAFSNNALASAEIYDPATGQWSATGNLNFARRRHTATLLSNGKVIIAGGEGTSGAPLSEAEIFDTMGNGGAGVFTQINNINHARSKHTAILMNDGQALIMGGEGASFQTLASAELYNPHTGQWSNTDGLSVSRRHHAAALLSNGQVLAVGGENSGASAVILASSELFSTLSITPVNDPPDAVNDAATTAEDTAVDISVLANDTDPDGNTLAVSIVTQGANGDVEINPNGTVKYTPNANFNGTDSFSYTVSDGNGGTDTATVIVTVTAVNDAPVARDDSYSVNEDTALTVAAPGALGNDTDADGDTLTASLVSGPTKGTLTLNSNGSFTYTPSANANGADNFTYRASDGAANSNTATVTITVIAVNDAPVANNDSYRTRKNTALTLSAPGVLGNDTDEEGDALTAAIVAGPSNGAVTVNANGSFTYTPRNGFSGGDSFTYWANDGALNSNTATVAITVSNQEDKKAPVTTATTSGDTRPCGPDTCFKLSGAVKLTADEPATTQYRVNGGAWQVYSGPFQVTSEANNLIEYFSTDTAGNVERIKSLAVKVTYLGSGVLDNFNRADGPLGPSWTANPFFNIDKNRVEVDTTGAAYWLSGAPFGASQEVYLLIDPAKGGNYALHLKVQGANPSYLNGAIRANYVESGSYVSIGTYRPGGLRWNIYGNLLQGVTFRKGDEFGVRALSSGEVKVYRNGLPIGTITLTAADQAFFNNLSGRIGVSFSASRKSYFDDFGGGTITP